MENFYAVYFAEETKSMTELINLSFDLHCYSLINNFSDLNKLGKYLYLTEKMSLATKELDELDRESYSYLFRGNSSFKMDKINKYL